MPLTLALLPTVTVPVIVVPWETSILLFTPILPVMFTPLSILIESTALASPSESGAVFAPPRVVTRASRRRWMPLAIPVETMQRSPVAETVLPAQVEFAPAVDMLDVKVALEPTISLLVAGHHVLPPVG